MRNHRVTVPHPRRDPTDFTFSINVVGLKLPSIYEVRRLTQPDFRLPIPEEDK